MATAARRKSTTGKKKRRPAARSSKAKAAHVPVLDVEVGALSGMIGDDLAAEFELGSASTHTDVKQYLGDMAQRGGGKIKAIMRDLSESSLRGTLKQCHRFRLQDDLINAIVNTKRVFFSAGFTARVKATPTKWVKTLLKLLADPMDVLKNPTRVYRLNQDLRKWIGAYQFAQVMEELIDQFETFDNLCLAWKLTSSSEVKWVQTIEPYRLLDYSGARGQKSLRVELTEWMKKFIREICAQEGSNQKGKERLLAQGLEEKYIDAVIKGDDYVDLKHEDGEYWIVRTLGPPNSGLAWPSMRTVFFDIVLRQMLESGDFAIAHFFKRVIQLIQHGEKAPGGTGVIPDRGPTWTTDEDLAKLEEYFQLPSDTLRLFVDHTVKINYALPPAEALEPDKYKGPDQRIIRWGDVADVIMTGEGGSYATGFLGIKKMVAKGEFTRRIVGEEVLAQFLMHPAMRGIFPRMIDDDTVRVLFDKQNLKEPSQLLDELTALYDRGAMSNDTFIEQLGFDPDTELQRKLEGEPMRTKWIPWYEPRQGMQSEKTGRPRSDNRPDPTEEKIEGDPKP